MNRPRFTIGEIMGTVAAVGVGCLGPEWMFPAGACVLAWLLHGKLGLRASRAIVIIALVVAAAAWWLPAVPGSWSGPASLPASAFPSR